MFDEMKIVKSRAEVCALYAEIQAENAELNGMDATNRERRLKGFSEAYDSDSFFDSSARLRDLARRLREVCSDEKEKVG